MKFTKEEAVKELTAKYAKPRYGEPEKWSRTIDECVEHAMKLMGEESNIELSQFVESVVPFLETTAGFVLKETSGVATDFKKQIDELKKQIEEAGKKNTDENGDNDALLKRIEALEKEKEAADNAAKISAKKSEIASKLKEKGVKDSDWVSLMLNKASLNAETDTEKEVSDYLEIYNKTHASGDDDDQPANPKGEPTAKMKSIIEAAGKIAKERIV